MLELKNICVSFRSERQDKIFGHTRQQVLFDISLSVKRGLVWAFWGSRAVGNPLWAGCCAAYSRPDSGEALLDGVSVYGSRPGGGTCRTSSAWSFRTTPPPPIPVSGSRRSSARVSPSGSGGESAGWTGPGRLPGCWSWWACPLTSPDAFPMSSPVASSSGYVSPGRWPAVRRSSF